MIIMTNGFTTTDEFNNQYNDLMMDTFGFSLEKWHRKRVWDDSYECYSIIENGIMIANISVYKMKLLINGSQQDCIQIGGVATRKEYRGKGLSRSLMEYILIIYPDTPSFLFANDDVLEFYPKFGYESTTEKQPYIECNLQSKGEMKKFELKDSKIDCYLRERGQFSKVLDCTNHYSINWFHIQNIYLEDSYDISDLDVMVVGEQKDNILRIYDVISKNPVSFPQIVPHLHFSGVDIIEFGFNPDWLGIDYSIRENKLEGSTLFVKGDFGVEREYKV